MNRPAQGGGKIWVPMPEADAYKKSMSRDELVNRYGEATVTRAEMAVVLNLFIMMGVIKPSEFVDAMVAQCERIDDIRRREARLESDRG